MATAYHRIHGKWRLKGAGFKAILEAMRKSGESSTSLGNSICNFILMMDMVEEYWDLITFIGALGDDAIILSKQPIKADKLVAQCKKKYNINVKVEAQGEVGRFLQFMVYDNARKEKELGPDYVRLRRRYEVPSGASEATPENIK